MNTLSAIMVGILCVIGAVIVAGYAIAAWLAVRKLSDLYDSYE